MTAIELAEKNWCPKHRKKRTYSRQPNGDSLISCCECDWTKLWTVAEMAEFEKQLLKEAEFTNAFLDLERMEVLDDMITRAAGTRYGRDEE